MTPGRLALVALVVGWLAVDLARTGSASLECRAEIARAEQEIGLLRRQREEVRVGIHARVLSRVTTLRTEERRPVRPFEITRAPTPWERAAEAAAAEDATQRAFASEAEEEPRGFGVKAWLEERGLIDPD